MTYDWANAGPMKIDVVSWPPATSVGSGRESAGWVLETLEDVSAGALRDGIGALRPVLRSKVLEVRCDVVDDRLLSCVVEYDSVLPVSERVLAAALLWRRLDEEVVRLWRVGGMPRADIAEFKFQRRQLAERLAADDRMLWMCASLVRVEPFWAAIAGRESAAGQLLEVLAGPDSARGFIAGTESRVRELRASNDAGTDRALDRLARRASEAFESEEINAVAGATEEVLEVFLRLSEPIARREDENWWLDCQDLLTDPGRARDKIAARSAAQIALPYVG